MPEIIDSDQHLYETRTLWVDHIDPALRDDALAIVDDELRIPVADLARRRLDCRPTSSSPGTPPPSAVTGNAAASTCRPSTTTTTHSRPTTGNRCPGRAARPSMGLDEAVLFPNFGLLWERRLSGRCAALTANMAAWNRWCATVVADGAGRLHPVAHLTLRDPEWLEDQLAYLSSAGVRLGMIAPAAVDGRPLSHPDHDRLWAAFVDHGVTPVFHVADQPRVLDDAFYTDSEEASFRPRVDLPVGAAGDRCDRPDRERRVRAPPRAPYRDRRALVNLGAAVSDDARRRVGLHLDAQRPRSPSSNLRPSEYFRRQVRVSSFSYEQPARLTAKSGDLYMCCSDYPHSEGTATPIEDYERAGCEPATHSGLFHDNVSALFS